VACHAAAEIFFRAVASATQAVIAGYWPHETELDCRPLLTRACEIGRTCVLPVMDQASKPLIFRQWQPGDILKTGPYDIREPAPHASLLRPNVVIVPLLAFDRRGYRLGYGAGFYDRTLSYLRREGTVLAVGYAFAAQEVENVPHDQHDERLDWIVTETEAVRRRTETK
jgi:5-formyltetrahydrofolate cyclo-ligase